MAACGEGARQPRAAGRSRARAVAGVCEVTSAAGRAHRYLAAHAPPADAAPGEPGAEAGPPELALPGLGEGAAVVVSLPPPPVLIGHAA